jgi:hypothetical protein
MTFAKTPIALLVAALAAVSVPAMAAPDEGKPLRVEVKDRAGSTVYCVTEETTGFAAPRKTCHTREQWIANGATFKIAAKRNPEGTALASAH